jgi:hypothetical protein
MSKILFCLFLTNIKALFFKAFLNKKCAKRPGSWYLIRVKAHVARTYKLCVKRELQTDDSADFEGMLDLSVYPKPYLSFVTFLKAT